MNDTELERYSRHILLNEFDIAGRKTQARHSLDCGLWRLSQCLYADTRQCGIGPSYCVCDGDTIESSNLQRQTSFTEADIGLNKAEVFKNLFASAQSPDSN